MKRLAFNQWRIEPGWLRQHLLTVALAGAAMVCAVAGLIMVSVWVEARFPLTESDAGSPVAQVREATTRPVVEALGKKLGRYVRGRMIAREIRTQISEEETIARYLSPSTPDGERLMLAYRLGRLETPDSIAALLRGFETAKSEQKALLAQILGNTGIPRMKDLLIPLLADGDERVVAAAVLGLGALDGEGSAHLIGGMIADRQQPLQVRVTAADALGEMGNVTARDALVQALEFGVDDDLSRAVLRSLGRVPFARVRDVFDRYLYSPETPLEMRSVAVEALALSGGDAVGFLLSAAGRDEDPDVRASAAWAISAQDSRAAIGGTLMSLAEREPDVDVRRRLYEALTDQPDTPVDRLWQHVALEEDSDARVAAFNALGVAAARHPAASARFDRVAVPELERIASNQNTLNVRMRAVLGLRRAGTPAAMAALARLATVPDSNIADAALAGLSRATNNPQQGAHHEN